MPRFVINIPKKVSKFCPSDQYERSLFRGGGRLGGTWYLMSYHAPKKNAGKCPSWPVFRGTISIIISNKGELFVFDDSNSSTVMLS